MDIKHAYAELGLTRPADEATVKAAWRRLASQWHPDRNPSEQAVLRMQRINHAFEQIRAAGFAEAADTERATRSHARRPEAAPASSDPSHASASTTRGRPGARSQGAAQPGDADPGPRAGQDRASASAAAPHSVQRKLKLSLEEAALGCTREFSGRFTAVCGVCEGRGHRVLASACPDCQGSGTQRPSGWFGLFGTGLQDRPCEACQGSGKEQPACTGCAGSGQQPPQAWRLAVRIPAGVRDGDELTVTGPAPRDGRAAVQLELRIALAPHPLFTLADDGTLHGQVPVDGFSWIAERTVDVPTLDGLQPLAMRREQRVYRLPGRGFPVARRGARGDAVVELLPVFPERFSADQQILLDQLIATMRPAAGQAGKRGRGASRERRASDDAASGSSPRLSEWQRTLAAWQRSRPPAG